MDARKTLEVSSTSHTRIFIATDNQRSLHDVPVYVSSLQFEHALLPLLPLLALGLMLLLSLWLACVAGSIQSKSMILRIVLALGNGFSFVLSAIWWSIFALSAF